MTTGRSVGRSTDPGDSALLHGIRTLSGFDRSKLVTI